MASQRSVAESSFLRVLEVDAAEAARHPEAFDRIRAGELHAIVVRGVYPPGLEDYFAAGTAFHAQLRALFSPDHGLVERVGGLLASLDRGRPFVAPPGEPY